MQGFALYSELGLRLCSYLSLYCMHTYHVVFCGRICHVHLLYKSQILNLSRGLLEVVQIGIQLYTLDKIVKKSILVMATHISLLGCGNIEPTGRHFDLFSSLLSCSLYTLYTVQFQFTTHLLENVLHDWVFPHYCTLIWVHV